MKTEKELLDEANAAALEAKREFARRSTHQHSAQQPTRNLSTDKDMVVKSDFMTPIITLYKTKFGTSSDYQAPKQYDDQSVAFSFPSKVEGASFFREAATEITEPLFILDATKTKVLGYSNGDGILYNADGTECKKGEQLNPAGVALKDFELPEQSSFRP